MGDLNLLINIVRVFLGDCPPTLHTLKCSPPIQMGISTSAEVPPLLNEPLEHEHFDFVFVSQVSAAFETKPLVEITLARDRCTPAVVLTRCLHTNCYLEAMQLGAADYLEKTLTNAEIEPVVRIDCKPWQGEISALES